MATGALHLCRMRISHLPDYPIHSCGVSCCCPSGRPHLRHLRDISTLKGSPPITTDVGINCINLFFLQKIPLKVPSAGQTFLLGLCAIFLLTFSLFKFIIPRAQFMFVFCTFTQMDRNKKCV
uniref:Uncharacterized protein n=1 Tax=Lutzomyia longipalpis TaxID=7200 RepID=A0A1B0CQ46_LUTLO